MNNLLFKLQAFIEFKNKKIKEQSKKIQISKTLKNWNENISEKDGKNNN